MRRCRIIHSRTTFRGRAIIGDHCEMGPNAYICLYTSIGDSSTVTNSKVENSIIMEGIYIDCGRRITDSLIGRKVRILSHEHSIPNGHQLILGDMAAVTL